MKLTEYTFLNKPQIFYKKEDVENDRTATELLEKCILILKTEKLDKRYEFPIRDIKNYIKSRAD